MNSDPHPASDASAPPAGPAPQAVQPERSGGFAWFTGRRLVMGLLILVAVLPALYVLLRTTEARRDLVYWDEFDTVLAFLLKLKEGAGPGAFLQDLFALNNEHRMVTSRLLFALSYWLTGTVNFAVFDWIGISWIFVMYGLLVATAGSPERRLCLGVVLSLLLFQLEHYENFLWAGSSIDHFQVVMLAAGAIVAVARGTRAGVLAGGVLAGLATYTLAHGLMIWPVGAAMLWSAGNRRRLALWCAMGGLAIGSFLMGFKVNQAQDFAALSLAGLGKVFSYWLSILGAVPALGREAFEPILGAVLLVLLVMAIVRGAVRHEPIALPLTLFALAAAGMIALGRAEDSAGEVYSRYYVLSALAWALTLFMLLEPLSPPRRPLRWLVLALPALVAFNVIANRQFADETDAWLESRDRAVTRFKQLGIDGRGSFKLHPNPDHATELLRKAEELGVYRLGPISQRRPFPKQAVVSNRMVYFVDEMTVNARSVFVQGWAAIPGQRSERGQIHLVLRSAKETLLYTTVPITRPDVAETTHQPDWQRSGFRFARRRDRLPTGEFQVGFLITYHGKSEYIMTAHRLILVGEGQALLASGE